jgi:hypothetical protein
MWLDRKVVGCIIGVLVLAITLPCWPQSLKVIPAPMHNVALPAQIRIYCANNYTSEKCAAHAGILAAELSKYQVSQLKQWSFAVVPSDEWKQLVIAMKGNPDSPAFTVLENRTTLFESALFEPVASRTYVLFKEFRAQGGDLLDLAVTHELGHALCSDPDERRAEENGQLIRAGKTVVCNRR